MKIGFISDIHGNYEALKTVLAELDRINVSKIYCLGDVVGYYPQINECCDELRKRNILCLMGNHDWYMAGGGFCPRSKSVNDCLLYQRKIISEVNLNWLRTFQIHYEVSDIKMVHGGWTNPIDEYLEPSSEYFLNTEGKKFVSGHTHIQRLEFYSNEIIYCNPGSVGQPRDNDPRAAYAIYENGQFTLYRTHYDFHVIFGLMEAAGFNDYYYGCLAYGSRNLRRL